MVLMTGIDTTRFVIGKTYTNNASTALLISIPALADNEGQEPSNEQ